MKRIFTKQKKRGNFLPLFTIFIVAFLYFLPIFIHPNQIIVPALDVFGQYIIWRSYFVEAIIKYHQLPFWNIYFFSGTPFLSNPLSAMFYPPTWLFLIIPQIFIFGFIFFIDTFFIGCFTYLFSRKINISRFSSFCAAVIFMLSGYNVLKVFAGHLSNLDGILWFAGSIYFVELFYQKKTIKNYVLLTISLTLFILSGHLQFYLYGMLGILIYFLLRLFLDFKMPLMQKVKILIVSVSSLVLSVTIAAVQLLPTLYHSQFTNRAGGVDFQFASSFSLTPKMLILSILPNFFGDGNIYWGKGSFWEDCLYIGLLPLLFCIFYLRKLNGFVFIFLILALFSILFSLGDRGIFTIFYYYFPGFKSFRIPSTFLFVYSFSVSILTATSIDYFLKNKNKIKSKLLLILLIITFILFLITLFIKTKNLYYELVVNFIFKSSYAIGTNRQYLSNLIINDLFYFFVIVAVFLFILILRNIIPIKLLKLAISITIILNLYFFSQKYISTKNFELAKNYTLPLKQTKIIQDDKTFFRILDLDTLSPLESYDKQFMSTTGYDPSFLLYYKEYFSKLGKHINYGFEPYLNLQSIENVNLAKKLNIKYIISQKHLSNKDLTLLADNPNLYQLDTYPRAYFVNDIKNSLHQIKIQNYTPNSITLITNTEKSEMLVLSEIVYPGWTAKINGKNILINKFDNIFRSLNVPKGLNKVELNFTPPLFQYGIALSITGVLIIILLILLSAFKFYDKK